MFDESLSLYQLIEQAKFDDTCTHGHDWQSVGGRFCGLWAKDAEDCQGTQTVYKCARCGEDDYGDKPGPGYDDCVKHCGRKG